MLLSEDQLIFAIVTFTFLGKEESRPCGKHREGEQGVEFCGRLTKFCVNPGGLWDHHWFWQICSNRDRKGQVGRTAGKEEETLENSL